MIGYLVRLGLLLSMLLTLAVSMSEAAAHGGGGKVDPPPPSSPPSSAPYKHGEPARSPWPDRNEWPKQRQDVIRIATQSPLSGELAAVGTGIKLGAQLAIAELKGPIERAGFTVALVPFDDQAKPDVGVANAKKIIANKEILAVIGHLNSGVAIPSSEVYKEAGLAMVSPANTHPAITDRNLPNVSRVVGRDDVQGVVGAQFAKEILEVTSVYIVHNKNPYGQGIAEFFREWANKNGVTVVGFVGTDERANFDSILTPILARNPDLIYFGGEYPQAALFRQAREKGITAKFMGPSGLASTELMKLGGEAVTGMHFTTVAGGVKEYPKAKEFAKAYRNKFGKDPEPLAAQAYDATAIALKAIQAAIKDTEGKATPSREVVSRAVRKVKHDGITGYVEFDDKGDPSKATYLVYRVGKEWKDNEVVKRLEIAAPAPK